MTKKLPTAAELFAQLGLTKRSRKGKAYKCPPGPLSEADAAEWDTLTVLGKRRSRMVDGRQTLREMQELAHLPDNDPLLDPLNYDPLLLPSVATYSTASISIPAAKAETPISPVKKEITSSEAKTATRSKRNIKFGK